MDQQTLPGSSYTPMTIGEWVITFIITYIPLVGLIMLFVWAFGGGAHPSKKTWAQAMLIMMLIGIVLAIVFFSIIVSLIGSFFGQYSTYS